MRKLAQNNRLANHRLLTACLKLQPGEFEAARTSFFPSLKMTLNHILTVDWFYLDAVEASAQGRSPEPDPARFFDPEQPFTTCAELRREQRATDARLISFCTALTDDVLDRPVAVVRRHGVERETTTRLLAHLFQHQIHHRGQMHAMLAGTSVKPPQLDEFFLANEAHLRAAELAELGFPGIR